MAQRAPRPDRLLTVREAADMLGLKPATVYDWVYKRRLPVVKLSGPRGPVRFRESDLHRFIVQHTRPAVRPAIESQLDGGSAAGAETTA